MEYDEIFNQFFKDSAQKIIVFTHKISKGKAHYYKPYSHLNEVSSESMAELGRLLWINLIFLVYLEEEIIDFYNKGFFSQLDNFVSNTYLARVPKRQELSEGLVGELLLDLLIKDFAPNSQKIYARYLERQNDDNHEIRGYDCSVISVNADNRISLWLGQSKIGKRAYCRKGLVDDLNEKYSLDYFCGKVSCFIKGPKVCLSDCAKTFLDDLNRTIMLSHPDEKKEKILEKMKENNVKIVIPCLLAYDKPLNYPETDILIAKETDRIMKSFEMVYPNTMLHFEFEILIMFFPIFDTQTLRSQFSLWKPKLNC